MRTTVRLDLDVLEQLRRRARAEKVSLTQLINRMLRGALRAPSRPPTTKRFRQQTFKMGPEAVDLRKALQLAGELETQEMVRKLAQRR